MSADRVLQAAVYAALDADATLGAIVSGVYDMTPPKGTLYPYTLIGDYVTTGEKTHDKDGASHLLTIHDWSALEGTKQVQQMQEAHQAVLDEATLSVSGWGLTKALWEFGTILTEWDADLKLHLRHGVTRYRCFSLAS